MKNGNGEVLVGAAIIFKEGKGKKLFLLTKNINGEWEIPKTTVRRGESSVRSVIRFTTEQGNMNARVLDEVGRLAGTTIVNSKSINQRTIYYLMFYKAGAEVMGLGDSSWIDYQSGTKRLKIKKEKDFLKKANEMVKEWSKNKKKNPDVEENEIIGDELSEVA
jgi:hypothetical protein